MISVYAYICVNRPGKGKRSIYLEIKQTPRSIDVVAELTGRGNSSGSSSAGGSSKWSTNSHANTCHYGEHSGEPRAPALEST